MSRKMTEALATFFRYTISNLEHLVTLEDELNNIENYYIIQHLLRGQAHLGSCGPEGRERMMKYKLPNLGSSQ